MEELDDVNLTLTEEEKAMVAANDKAGLITEVACHFCGMQFDIKKTRSLRAHIEEVHVVGDMGFMCGVCCEEFTSRKAVENHMSTLHRAPKPLGCGICGETFRIRNLLLKHIYGHSKEEIDNKKAGLYYCGECFDFFESVMSLQAHVLYHREVPVFVCAACGLQTQHRHVMVKHLETHVICNLLTASELKESNGEIKNYFPQPVQIDASKIESSDGPEIQHGDDNVNDNNMDTNTTATSSVESDSSEQKSNETAEAETVTTTTTITAAATTTVVVPEEEASYKCGICDELFTNLAEALTHAGTHQDSEGAMQQVEINVLMEEKVDSSSVLGGDLIDNVVKAELLDAESMDVV